MNAPAVGQDVFVLLSDGEPLDAHVDGADGSTLFLCIWSGADTRVREVTGSASVQFTHQRGICEIAGVLRGRDPATERVPFEPTSSIRIVQRRDYVRVEAIVPVSFDCGGLVETYTTNVSGGGFMIAAGDALGMGGTAAFTLALPEGDGAAPLTVFGRAVRRSGGKGLAIAIEEITARDRERLVRFVFDRERLARRVMRQG